MVESRGGFERQTAGGCRTQKRRQNFCKGGGGVKFLPPPFCPGWRGLKRWLGKGRRRRFFAPGSPTWGGSGPGPPPTSSFPRHFAPSETSLSLSIGNTNRFSIHAS